MEDFLEKIIQHKKRLLARKKPFYDAMRKNIRSVPMTRYGLFKENISRPGQVNLIAEIKKASPSRGVIRRDFNVLQLARIYAENGAAAVSVLTEDKYFLGKPGFVREVSESIPLPVLTKDFIIDAAQIYEAFLCGTSAVLLIAAILDDAQLALFIKTAATLDLDSLVEVHDEAELDRALQAGAEIIGINHRDLRTFDVDLAVSRRLVPRIPQGRVIVAESGIKTHDDVMMVKGLGVHAVLVGETLMASADVGAALRDLMRGGPPA